VRPKRGRNTNYIVPSWPPWTYGPRRSTGPTRSLGPSRDLCYPKLRPMGSSPHCILRPPRIARDYNTRHYHVPYSKLYHRLQGRSATKSNGGLNKALSIEQENALLLYVNWCEELGRLCKYKHIELAANSLLFASGSFNTVSAS